MGNVHSLFRRKLEVRAYVDAVSTLITVLVIERPSSVPWSDLVAVGSVRLLARNCRMQQ